MLGFSPIRERICTLWIKGKFHNITFFNVYASTEDTEDETVDEFYETLQCVCDELPEHDAIITLGDFNAKLGKEQSYKDITGRHSLHEVTNNSGHRLVQYAGINNFKVLSTWYKVVQLWPGLIVCKQVTVCPGHIWTTLYPRKDIYKGTWKIQGGSNMTGTICV